MSAPSRAEEAWRLLAGAEVVCTEAQVEAALQRLADEITAVAGRDFPLVLQIMQGASVFCGMLLPRLRFPLELDYLHATRYGAATAGGSLQWVVPPPGAVRGRHVLVLDDILDEGHTLAAVRQALLDAGAASVRMAVLCTKDRARQPPLVADFSGLTVPDRYVFGCGMDVRGAWRNLPAIHALAAADLA